MTSTIFFRILGNENPPRDTPGRREQALRYLLTSEPEFPGVSKWYLLNRIFDRTYQRQLCETLDRHNAHYVTVPFPAQPLTSLSDVKTRGVGLNQARNLAIAIGGSLARYVAVLDGDCFFEPAGWEPIAAELAQDRYRYLSVPFRRQGAEHCGEPQLIFRDDSELRFDESLPFGQGDKLELLYRLGHERTPHSGHLRIEGDLTRLVGEVRHYSTGEELYEASLPDREWSRNESMQRFAERVCHWPRLTLEVGGPHARHWQELDGDFDFAAVYAAFALDAPDQAHFVEIGSRQGKGVSYLATRLRALGKRARVDAVDDWSEEALTRFQANLRAADLLSLVRPVRLDPVAAAEQYTDGTLDVVYLDGDQAYERVRDELNAWYPKLKPGGILAGHDFVFEPEHRRSGVVRAVLEFCRDKPLEVLPQTRTWKSIKYGDERPADRRRRWS
jgi:hypothetical protein